MIKYILFLILFCSSCFAAANYDYAYVKWQCYFCTRLHIGSDPPKTQRCAKLRCGFHVWKLQEVKYGYKSYKS